MTCCLSAANVTQLKNKNELSAGSSTGEASISGAEPGKSVEGFKYTHIQMDRRKYTETQGNLQIPQTPRGICCVIREHTNHLLHQRLAVTQKAYFQLKRF